jgi:hypothetical protein
LLFLKICPLTQEHMRPRSHYMNFRWLGPVLCDLSGTSKAYTCNARFIVYNINIYFNWYFSFCEFFTKPLKYVSYPMMWVRM